VNAHSSDVSTSFTTDPEDTQIFFGIEFKELAFVNGSDSQLSLNSRDSKRRDELEECRYYK